MTRRRNSAKTRTCRWATTTRTSRDTPFPPSWGRTCTQSVQCLNYRRSHLHHLLHHQGILLRLLLHEHHEWIRLGSNRLLRNTLLLHLLPYLRCQPNVVPPCVEIHGALIKGLPTGTEELPRIPTGIEGIEGIP